MFLSGDPCSDYDRYSDESEKELEQFPKCAWCGEPITDDECYDMGDELIHLDCLKEYCDEHCMVCTDRYIN